MQAELKLMRVRGLETAWLEQGARGKKIALLLHGFPDSADSWDHQIDALAEAGYCVIAPYGRGAGPSATTKRVKRYDPEAYSLDLLAILDEVDPERAQDVYLVGHDLGVAHAWGMASLLKKRAKGLVVINGLTIPQMMRRFKNPRQLARSWYMFAMQVPVVPEMLAKFLPRRCVKLAHDLGGLPQEARPKSQLVERAIAGPLNQYRAFLRAAPRAMLHPQTPLRCPVLVIWGSRDKFLLPPTIDELERDAARLTVRIIQGNHWLQRERPGDISKLIGDFFHNAQAEVLPV